MAADADIREKEMQETWDTSFRDQIARSAYNTAPVEALVRTVSHHLRAHSASGDYAGLKFLEVGCGAAPNLIWLAEKGIEANGLDISPTALELAARNFSERKLEDHLGALKLGSATELPFDDNSMDGILESCVFQHLNKEDRIKAFAEVVRVLKPGGVFAGHMLNQIHTTYQSQKDKTWADDPGTVTLAEEGNEEKIHLESIGLAHFFAREEFDGLLSGCALIDPCELTYELPRDEAARRGYDRYRQGMWVVYAVK